MRAEERRNRHYALVDQAASRTILSLDDGGNRLCVTAKRHEVPGQDQPLYDLSIEAVAYPFRGTVTDLVMVEDLAFFRDNLRRLPGDGLVVFGGERAAELSLAFEQTGDTIVVEALLTPSADDPYPQLRWLIFGQQRFAQTTADAIDELLGHA